MKKQIFSHAHAHDGRPAIIAYVKCFDIQVLYT